MDRILIGDLLEAQIGRRFKNKEEAARLSRIGRQTLYRVLSGDENVQKSTIRRVERGLDLPNGALFSIADHDLESAIALGTRTAECRVRQRGRRTRPCRRGTSARTGPTWS